MTTPDQHNETAQLPFPEAFKPEGLSLISSENRAQELFGYNQYDPVTRDLIAQRAAELAKPIIHGLSDEIDDSTRRIEAIEQERLELESRKRTIQAGLSRIRCAAVTSYPPGYPKPDGTSSDHFS